MSSAVSRRQRLHELLLALVAREDELPLLEADRPDLEGGVHHPRPAAEANSGCLQRRSSA